MRAFVAVELGDEVRGKLAQLQLDLPDEVRRVKPENLHLTLSFLGEIDDEKVGLVKGALDSVSTGAFELECKGVGAFPSADFVRVVWAGALGEGLRLLHSQVNYALKSVGFKEERFSPHITIG